jgi:hypothetical protein
LLFFGYSVKMNKGNSGFSFSGSKDTLPVNFKEFQTNYRLVEEDAKKISILEKKIEELEKLNNHDKK